MDSFTIVHASQLITMEESPVAAIRRKKDSSMVRAMEMIREDSNSVLISAGSTGALLAGGLLKVGRIKGMIALP